MLRIEGLKVKAGGFSLGEIDLEIGRGEYFVILGPTGAGKSLLLETIAGLRSPSKGRIWIEGMEVTALPPERRKVGYVPQDYVLFPFLNVFGNIAFGVKGKDKRERVMAVAEMVGISHLLDRPVTSLSGGEKQRVALARALAPRPKVLLLDEPLSALDLKTSKYLRLELKRIQRELSMTTVHVTHNQAEAEEMADRIAVLNQGRIEQVGTPMEVFFYPRNCFVSDFIGGPNILECEGWRELGHGLVEVSCKGIKVIVPHEGGEVKRIAIPPRDVYVTEAPPPGPSVNRFKGVVKGLSRGQGVVRLSLEVGGNDLVAEIPYGIFETMDLKIGRKVHVILKLRAIRVCEGPNPFGEGGT